MSDLEDKASSSEPEDASPVPAPSDGAAVALSPAGIDDLAWKLAAAALAAAALVRWFGPLGTFWFDSGRFVSADWFPEHWWWSASAAWAVWGVVVVLVAGRRWSGSWCLVLFLGVVLTLSCLGDVLTPLVGTEYVRVAASPTDDSARVMDARDFIALWLGLLLLYAAWRQERAWRRSLSSPRPDMVDAATLRPVIVGGVLVVLASVVVGAAGADDLKPIELAALVTATVVAYEAAHAPRAAVWVLSLAGVSVVTTAASDLFFDLAAHRLLTEGLAGADLFWWWASAVLLAGAIAWALVTLLAAAAQHSLVVENDALASCSHPQPASAGADDPGSSLQ
jgi:hypothetical protein